MLFLILGLAIADDPDGEALCADAWQLATDHMVEVVPENPEPCGPWDPEMYNPETGACQFTCGEDDHFEVIL